MDAPLPVNKRPSLGTIMVGGLLAEGGVEHDRRRAFGPAGRTGDGGGMIP